MAVLGEPGPGFSAVVVSAIGVALSVAAAMIEAMAFRASIAPPQPAVLDEAAILRSIPRGALEKGRACAQRGRFRNLSLTEDGGAIQAETLGSAPRPYRQRITILEDRNGRPLVAGSCTCPVGANRKHVAAVLVAARSAQAPGVEPPPAPPAAAWLHSLEGAEDAESGADPDSVRQRLLYVLDIAPALGGGSGGLHVACFSAVLRKAGALGAPRRYAPHQVDTPARYLRPSDKTILRRFARLRFGASGLDRDDDPLELLLRFQAGGVPVFLISLKAGGVGRNLTAADTVIHYDPWWNPAVDDQATDRAPRIGRDKRVFLHRLTTLGTIEEKMETLKEKKRALAASVLDAEHGRALKLTEADVEELFAPT